MSFVLDCILLYHTERLVKRWRWDSLLRIGETEYGDYDEMTGGSPVSCCGTSEMQNDIFRVVKSRCLLITATIYIGLASSGVERGDEIYIYIYIYS